MQRLGIERGALDRLRADVSRARLGTLNDRTGNDGVVRPTTDVAIPNDDDHHLEQKELIGYLRDAVQLLPDRHRLIIIGYFLEGRTMTELGQLLGVTQSRASQIKGEALGMMRKGLEAALEAEPGGGRAASQVQDDYNRSLQAASAWRDRLVSET